MLARLWTATPIAPTTASRAAFGKWMRQALSGTLIAAALTAGAPVAAAPSPIPRIGIAADGRRTLYVDGKPFFILATQLHNSSAWPGALPDAWAAAVKLAPNTIEAPVYWEQFEPERGRFDPSNVDLLIAKARQTKKRLILLWFGTWKNGQNRYTPTWMRSDLAHYPRMLDPRGEPVDVQSTVAPANQMADQQAYVALMRHLKAVDGDAHTVIMVQVENEPGAIGTIRDHGAAANALFAQPVPEAVTTKLGKPQGTWQEVFGVDAEEAFSAWSTASFIEKVAAAGRAVYPLPVYVNCWMRYKGFRSPGIDYPSGGPVWTMFDLWRAVTPSIDMIGTDVYTTDPSEYRKVLEQYARPDNPSWVSETDFNAKTAPYLFHVLAHGGIGFSVFGIDNPDPSDSDIAAAAAHRENFALLDPIQGLIAQAATDHQIYAAVEEPGRARQILPLADGWQAVISFGPPPRGDTPGVVQNSKDHAGRVFVIRQGPGQWLVGGTAARVEFSRTDGGRGQLLRVEDGVYENGQWQMKRWLNGDETDFGLNFFKPGLLRVTTGQY